MRLVLIHSLTQPDHAMNSIRDIKARVQDFTTPQPVHPAKRIDTVTDNGALFLAFDLRKRSEVSALPRLRHVRMAPVTLDELRERA